MTEIQTTTTTTTTSEKPLSSSPINSYFSADANISQQIAEAYSTDVTPSTMAENGASGITPTTFALVRVYLPDERTTLVKVHDRMTYAEILGSILRKKILTCKDERKLTLEIVSDEIVRGIPLTELYEERRLNEIRIIDGNGMFLIYNVDSLKVV